MTPPSITRTRRVTIADVSRAAGCSKGVVSAVVNHAKGNITVSDTTRERVLAAAEELGYRPNFASRSLARQSTRTIGVYVPPHAGASLGYSYEGRILRGIEAACRDADFDLLVLNISGGLSPAQCQERFAEGRMDGLLLLHLFEDADWVGPLAAQHPNVIAVNYYGEAPIRRVNFDDAAALRLSVQHLLDQGHRQIAFLGGVEYDFGPGDALRCDGYRQAMAAAGLAVHPDWVWDHSNPRFAGRARKEWSTAEVDRAMRHFLGLGAARPTAIACPGDQLALRAMHYCARHRIAVPEALAIIGVDDSEHARSHFPTLSSVRQPLEEMGRHAARLLIREADGAAAQILAEPLWQPSLVVRESTTALMPE